MKASNPELKIVLIGDAGVGKSNLVLRFVADEFIEGRESTVGAAYMSKVMKVDGTDYKFNIWDTAGQERFHRLAKMYYKDADAAILVYDITSSDTFDALERWNSELIEHGPSEIIKIIAANKEDLVDFEEVSYTQATDYASQINAYLTRTSAKSNTGVEKLFESVAKRAQVAEKVKRVDTVTIKDHKLHIDNKKCC